ncbi:hypothetical protein ACQ4PT_003070 [Festuca glaucescens]
MEVGGVDSEWRHWPGWDLIPERAKKIMQRNDDFRLCAVGASACSSSLSSEFEHGAGIGGRANQRRDSASSEERNNEASGLKVNYSKTTATLIRGKAGDEERVKETLGCEIAKFPIRYLGLQLALRPLTKAQWQPMLDSVVHFIPAWFRGMIGREGRLSLIKSVVTAKPVHQLLVAEAPAWLLEEITKCMRAFFWAGKNQVHGGAMSGFMGVYQQTLQVWWAGCQGVKITRIGAKSEMGMAPTCRPGRPWQGLSMMRDIHAMEVFQSKSTSEMGGMCGFGRIDGSMAKPRRKLRPL